GAGCGSPSRAGTPTRRSATAIVGRIRNRITSSPCRTGTESSRVPAWAPRSDSASAQFLRSRVPGGGGEADHQGWKGRPARGRHTIPEGRNSDQAGNVSRWLLPGAHSASRLRFIERSSEALGISRPPESDIDRLDQLLLTARLVQEGHGAGFESSLVRVIVRVRGDEDDRHLPAPPDHVGLEVEA